MIEQAKLMPLREAGQRLEREASAELGTFQVYLSESADDPSAEIIDYVLVDGRIWVNRFLIVDDGVGTEPSSATVRSVTTTLQRWNACANELLKGGALLLMTEHGRSWVYAAGDPFRNSFSPAAWLLGGSERPVPPESLYVIDMRQLPNGMVGAVIVNQESDTLYPRMASNVSLWLLVPGSNGEYLVDGIVGGLIAVYPNADEATPASTAIAIE